MKSRLIISLIENETDEDAILKEVIENAVGRAWWGRISVITFHSLEDKICKYTFNDVTKLKDVPPGLPVIPDYLQPRFKLINKKAMVASKEELEVNHRAHSAKLRIIEREFENET